MTRTFTPAEPIWCAGCGDFGVQSALATALDTLGIAAHEVMILAGIGCAGTIQNNLDNYGYHAMHGRVLPTATGVVLANPGLTVIAAGGDGDGYAIGGGHLLHTFKRNPSFAYIVMNNGTYGLTKGQVSPSSQAGFRGTTDHRATDPIMLGLSMPGTTFLARGYSGDAAQLARLTDAAIEHSRAGKGFAFLDVISPCVAYNDRYHDWRARLRDVETIDGYDPRDRSAAFSLGLELDAAGKTPTGLLYEGEGLSLEATLGSTPADGPADSDIEPAANLPRLRELMESFRG